MLLLIYDKWKMNLFDPANLSPIPKALTPSALPFDLTWDDLRPILPGFDERECARAEAFISHEKQGLHAVSNSYILTLRYPAGENQLRSQTIFCKKPKSSEAQKYRYLASHGVPTPRLLAALDRGEGEIVLLEFLPTIGIDYRSAGEVDNLLHLLARLNSVPYDLELFKPASQGVPRAQFDRTVWTALAELSQDRTLPFTIDVPRWFAAYQSAQQACDSLPLALNHNEFFFQQVGWVERGPSRRLVIFDLETLFPVPRFTDLASILYPLAVYSGRAQEELFEVYVDRLRQLHPPVPGFDEALRELQLLRIRDSCYSLPWLVADSKHPDAVDLRAALAMITHCLNADLIALGFL